MFEKPLKFIGTFSALASSAYGFSDLNMPSVDVLAAESPVLQQENQTLSKTMRAELQEVHDASAKNKFTDSVFAGKVSTHQYELALKQNLAIFECFRDLIEERTDIDPGLKEIFKSDLGSIIEGFRADLKLSKDQKLKDKDILKGTSVILDGLRKMSSPEIVACAYQDAGGNAFGTHDIAEALEKNLGIKNTKGFTVYTIDTFMKLVGKMNTVFTDKNAFPKMIGAAKWFFTKHKEMTDSSEFDVK